MFVNQIDDAQITAESVAQSRASQYEQRSGARKRSERGERSGRRSHVPIEIVLSFPFRGPRFEGSKICGPHLFRKYTHTTNPSWAFISFFLFLLRIWSLKQSFEDRQTQRGEENALLLLLRSCCCHNSSVMTHPWPLPLTPKPLLLPSLKPPK